MPESGPTFTRPQQTIRRPVEICGIGFLTGAEVTLRFVPAPVDHGIQFQRVDCFGSDPIPACIEFTVPRQRRTAIEYQGVVVEMTEHVMAALAGLQIDNCLVQLNAPEPPGGDGSSFIFARALLDAEFLPLDATREQFTVRHEISVSSDDGQCEILVAPSDHGGLMIGYELDYGPNSPIPQQKLTVNIHPDTFLDELAFARTFILESEIATLRARGYGKRTTARDLLVFGPQGVIDNQLRSADECVRHKILDCLGDYALLGADVIGQFAAVRSGHQLNREVVRRLIATHSQRRFCPRRRAA